jgi:hypothetical protein
MTTAGAFLPSTHGFHFNNFWPEGTPDFTVHVPGLGVLPIGDAHNGLCGGMAFAAADLYHAHRSPPADTTAPAAGTPWLSFFAARLRDSFNLPSGVLRYYTWANTPDHDTGVWPLRRPGLARRTIRDQLPKILADIDGGRPATLGLVTVRSFDPTQLGHCHQVLAYGYQWSGARITLRVYDPNQHDADDVTISLDTGASERSHVIDNNVNIGGRPIRGFFHVEYSFAEPPKATVAR